MLQVNASAVLRYVGDGTAEIVGRHNRDSADVIPLGTRLPLDDDSALAQVARTAAPARIDDWAGGSAAERFRYGYRSTAAAPIMVAARCGAPSRSRASNRCRRTPRTASATFAELVSLGRRLRAGAHGPDRLPRPAREGR